MKNYGPISLKVDDPYELQLFGQNIEDIIGEEIHKLIDIAYSKAQEILMEHIDKLHEIAQVLLQKEVISSEEFESFFE